ncbi:hypothetical protein [Amycolatopsis orientalis]|uniref:hypothetical protein n=1 Tax=Amycolatopsis orientalis TaxID=31958 RepID=UPI0003AA131F|nr:hypothetical protein [Amycolatopsis orientalis]
MRISLAVTGLVLLAAGCAAGVPAPAPAPSSGPPSSSAVSATPLVAKDLTKYLPSEDELTKAGLSGGRARLPYVVGPNTPLHIVRACGSDQPWDPAARNGAQAYSLKDTLSIRQRLAEYQGYTGEQVVSGLDKALACGKSVSEDHDLAIVTRFSTHGKGLPEGSELTVKTRFSVPGTADPQLGFCGQYAEAHMVSCVLVLARGDRVLAVTTSDSHMSMPKQQAEVTRLAPTFLAAFDQG